MNIVRGHIPLAYSLCSNIGSDLEGNIPKQHVPIYTQVQERIHDACTYPSSIVHMSDNGGIIIGYGVLWSNNSSM